MNGTKIRISSGSEGPSYDPYHYDDITVTRMGREVTLHLGLGCYLEVDGKVIMSEGNEFPSERIVKEFELRTGLNPNTAMKYHQILRSRCSECGCKRTTSHFGYVGETILVCDRCGNFVSDNFHMGMIE